MHIFLETGKLYCDKSARTRMENLKSLKIMGLMLGPHDRYCGRGPNL